MPRKIVYRTQRKTVVTVAASNPPPKRRPPRNPETVQKLTRGMFDIFHADNGMTLIDACIPTELAGELFTCYLRMTAGR